MCYYTTAIIQAFCVCLCVCVTERGAVGCTKISSEVFYNLEIY